MSQHKNEEAVTLWKLLDDIDSYSDMAKGDDALFRRLVERKVTERFDVYTSDGYNLFKKDKQTGLDIRVD